MSSCCDKYMLPVSPSLSPFLAAFGYMGYIGKDPWNEGSRRRREGVGPEIAVNYPTASG